MFCSSLKRSSLRYVKLCTNTEHKHGLYIKCSQEIGCIPVSLSLSSYIEKLMCLEFNTWIYMVVQKSWLSSYSQSKVWTPVNFITIAWRDLPGSLCWFLVRVQNGVPFNTQLLLSFSWFVYFYNFFIRLKCVYIGAFGGMVI